jgi:hypothetical protein
LKTFTVTEKVTCGISLRGDQGWGIPFGQGLKALVEDTKDVWDLCYAHGLDINEDKEGKPARLVQEQYASDKRALIDISTSPGEGGEVKLYANMALERWDETRRRVVREPRPLAEAVGVKVFGVTEESVLVGMLPGASLRIIRTGALEGAPREMVLLWTGKVSLTGSGNPGDWGLQLFTRGRGD